MADSAEPKVRRYSAFLSYSQGDTPFVRKLHRRLEAYRLPARLGKGDGARRLKPIFRDSDELAAAPDLTTAVRAALAEADFLIVICTPRSAQSKWVGREIELFRHLHGDQRILTALVEGDTQTSFHPALLRRPHGRATEPLAADFRPGMGGDRIAFLKLMAPLAGVELDELIHRDGQRRIRQVMAGSGAAVAGTAVVATLAVIALEARTEAQAQRNRAGGLNAFLSTDLHKELNSAGRLDLQMAVDKAALNSYRGQDLSRLPPEELGQRARVLHKAGEDNEKHGDLKTAQAQFQEAQRTTAALLAARPGDSQRIFDHAQSEYWVGYLKWRNGDGDGARAGFKAYARLGDRLVAIDPNNDAWRMEVAYAANNLGMLALRHDGQAAEAKLQFAKSVEIRQQVARNKPGDAAAVIDISNSMAWLADSQRIGGDPEGARSTRESQRKLLSELLKTSPNNAEAVGDMLGNELGMARIEAAEGQWRSALSRLKAGQDGAKALAARDPANKTFSREARMFELFTVRTWLVAPRSARPSIADMQHMLGSCAPMGSGASYLEISDFCAALHGQLLELGGDRTGAAADFARARQAHRDEAYSARWGLNFGEETTPPIRLVQK